jgi:lipoprotein-anchoring transpeptidase ErfK/SrfK
MNKALIRADLLAGRRLPSREIVRSKARRAFAAHSNDLDGPLVTTWERNDFGIWAYNLRRGGSGTPYYIHTTPEDERDTANRIPFSLAQSHGCIHIRPDDRDTMMGEHYLDRGIHLEVKGYAAIGPP